MQYFTEKLENGLTIFYGEIKDSPLVNLNIRINYGSRDERVGEGSFYHLLEHVMLSGSTPYPDEFAIAKVKEETGSYLNASTGPECINVVSEFLAPDIEKIFDLSANFVTNPIITQERIDREKGIINQELSRLTNDPHRSVYYYSMKSLFHGTNLAQTPFGDDGALGEVSIEQIKDLHQKILDPERMALICLGDLDFEQVKSLTKKYFSHLSKKAETYSRPVIKLNPQIRECDFVSQKSKIVRINFLTVPYGHPDDYALTLLSWILSDGFDSRLYQALRVKTELVYTVNSDNSAFSDAGFFWIKFPSNNPDEAIGIVYEELAKISEISEEELASNKKSLVNTRKRGFWSNRESLIGELGYSFTSSGLVENPEEFETKINQVSLEDIIGVAKKYLTPDKAILIRTK